MREYTMDIEDNLNKAYEGISGGAQKKFGIDNLHGFRTDEGSEVIPALKIEREIERMNKHAEEFLKALPEKHNTYKS